MYWIYLYHLNNNIYSVHTGIFYCAMTNFPVPIVYIASYYCVMMAEAASDVVDRIEQDLGYHLECLDTVICEKDKVSTKISEKTDELKETSDYLSCLQLHERTVSNGPRNMNPWCQDYSSESDSDNEGRKYEKQVAISEREAVEDEVSELADETCKLKQKDEALYNKIEELRKTLLEDVGTLLNLILTPERKMVRNPAFGTTSAKAWEYFATGFFEQVVEEEGISVEYCGGPNDDGVDILLSSRNTKPIAVVQVKCGGHFSSGKGKQIILGLVGSCVLHKVHYGVIFSDENEGALTRPAKDLLQRFRNCNGYVIHCYFLEEIVSKVQGSESPQILLRGFFDCLRKRK